MKEYRIKAEFSDVHAPRTYRRKVFTDRHEAEMALVEAKRYYEAEPFSKYNPQVFIECRSVTEWERE